MLFPTTITIYTWLTYFAYAFAVGMGWFAAHWFWKHFP
jgi:hypothetical protein